MQQPNSKHKQGQRNIAMTLLAGSAVMLLLSFASVPLYRAFCAATGFGGTPQKSATPLASKQGARVLTVSFDSNVSRDLAWRFEPETSKISLRTGEMKTIYYKVANLSDQPTSAQAAYNVSPDQAGAFFVKVACFCFEEKRLGPHESAEWPVVFYLDPALENEESMQRVEEVTLSYSFFSTKTSPKPRTSDAAAVKSKS
jgi:cytochrome c oxidase assembly protein subunit 11